MDVTELDYTERLAARIKVNYDALMMNRVALLMFMRNFRPAEPGRPHQTATSYEIVQRLEDTCTLTVDEVTAELLLLGYKLYRDYYGEVAWWLQSATRGAADAADDIN